MRGMGNRLAKRLRDLIPQTPAGKGLVVVKGLSYSVPFPSTGRILAANVAFRPGFGVITGPNESGKSQILEVIRFCLFGSAALRGKAEDYKSLKAELQFAVRGDDYSVMRTGTSAKLLRGKRRSPSASVRSTRSS